MTKRKRRRLLVIVALAGLALWLGGSALVTWRLTRRLHEPYPEPPPRVSWATVEGHRLKTVDDQQIGAWLVRGDRRKGCVLLLHGIGASRGQMLPVMRLLAEAHFTVLAISLRAHGDSTGQVNDFGYSSRHDVVAAVRFLQQECPRQPIYVLGHSMGAATAIFAAHELNESVAGYFLEQPYRDLSSATWIRVQRFLPPLLDGAAYFSLRLWATVFLPIDPQRISPLDRVEDIPESVPIVFASGSADRRALPKDVAALFDRVRSHAKLVVFDGANHEALDSYDPQLYRTSLFELLSRGHKIEQSAGAVN